MLSMTLAEQDTPSTVPYSGSSGATTVSGYPIADDVTAYFGNVAYSHTFSPVAARSGAPHRRSATTTTRTSPSAPSRARRSSVSTSRRIWSMVRRTFPGGVGNVCRIQSLWSRQHRRQHPSRSRMISPGLEQHSLKFGFYASAYRDAMIYGYYLNGGVRLLWPRHADRLGQRPAPTS